MCNLAYVHQEQFIDFFTVVLNRTFMGQEGKEEHRHSISFVEIVLYVQSVSNVRIASRYPCFS